VRRRGGCGLTAIARSQDTADIGNGAFARSHRHGSPDQISHHVAEEPIRRDRDFQPALRADAEVGCCDGSNGMGARAARALKSAEIMAPDKLVQGGPHGGCIERVSDEPFILSSDGIGHRLIENAVPVQLAPGIKTGMKRRIDDVTGSNNDVRR